jgi:hypothetical protein
MWSEGEPVSPSVPLAYGMSFSGTLLGQFLGMVITPVVAETSLRVGMRTVVCGVCVRVLTLFSLSSVIHPGRHHAGQFHL